MHCFYIIVCSYGTEFSKVLCHIFIGCVTGFIERGPCSFTHVKIRDGILGHHLCRIYRAVHATAPSFVLSWPYRVCRGHREPLWARYLHQFCIRLSLCLSLRLLGLWEEFSLMLARSPWLVCGCGAAAGFRRHHIVGVLLVAEHQDHFAGEPVERGHLCGHLAMMLLVCDQLLYSFYGLRFRACAVEESSSGHDVSPNTMYVGYAI